ncbi:hypothetical protein [Caballeronia zhejiangensis]|uniref:hypothetical protein n=1 Tax=Caballeronia zhejiangensis TaxID=871203 RepID=UPI0015882C7D|nr:hypothetical protein [Caballeronia zhejiangensis]
MKTYARLDNSVVAEIIQPAAWPADMPEVGGEEIPIAQRFTPEFVSTLVDVTGVAPAPQFGWVTTDGGKTFSAP